MTSSNEVCIFVVAALSFGPSQSFNVPSYFGSSPVSVGCVYLDMMSDNCRGAAVASILRCPLTS